jgi:hypothetical protein
MLHVGHMRRAWAADCREIVLLAVSADIQANRQAFRAAGIFEIKQRSLPRWLPARRFHGVRPDPEQSRCTAGEFGPSSS